MNFNKYKNITKQYDLIFSSTSKIFNKKNLKKLIIKKNKTLGRSYGNIVTYHKGGGVKRKYRLLKNLSNNQNFGLLLTIEYDPNKSSFIGLVLFQNGSFSYISLSTEANIGDIINLNDHHVFSSGNSKKLINIPIGTSIFNIERIPNSGPVYSKAGGSAAILKSKTLKFARVLLPSGKERLFDLNCQATLGSPSNIYNNLHKKYKAGTNRLLNKRPTVRGVAMNPVDHPHGGGEGKTSGGRPSSSPWGKLTKGVKTSKNLRRKNKFVLNSK